MYTEQVHLTVSIRCYSNLFSDGILSPPKKHNLHEHLCVVWKLLYGNNCLSHEMMKDFRNPDEGSTGTIIETHYLQAERN
jgi:hypothetical protein